MANLRYGPNFILFTDSSHITRAGEFASSGGVLMLTARIVSQSWPDRYPGTQLIGQTGGPSDPEPGRTQTGDRSHKQFDRLAEIG